MTLSEQSWEAAVAEALHIGRDVIRLRAAALTDENSKGAEAWHPVIEALQHTLCTFDERWKEESKRAPGVVVRDYALRVLARRDAALLLGTEAVADLFGMTPATLAIQRLVELLVDTVDVQRLQARLEKAAVRTVVAYGELLTALAELPQTEIRFEWESPSGERSEVELRSEQLQAGKNYVLGVTETTDEVQMEGKLTAMDAQKRLFRIVTESGTVYEGKWSKALRKRYGKEPPVFQLPIKAEATLEIVKAYQPSIRQETVRVSLLELDTDLGLDTEETLYTLQELYRSLDASLEQDSGYIEGKGVSLADYTALVELVNALLESNPAKGALRLLEPTDTAAVYDLLAAGKPISKLARFDARGLGSFDGFGDDEMPGSRTALRARSAGDLAKLTAAAYVDIVQLLKRLASMIEALEQGGRGAADKRRA